MDKKKLGIISTNILCFVVLLLVFTDIGGFVIIVNSKIPTRTPPPWNLEWSGIKKSIVTNYLFSAGNMRKIELHCTVLHFTERKELNSTALH